MHAKHQLLASMVICLPLLTAQTSTSLAQTPQSGPPEITGPVVRRPVSPQLRQENLNTLRERQTSRSELHAKPSSSVSRPNWKASGALTCP